MTNHLDGAHPLLVNGAPKIIARMAELGHVMRVFEGRRTLERQKYLYEQGRTRPGKIVTKTDGVRYRSKHQVQKDGFHHALDFVFVVKGKPTWDGPWDLFGKTVKEVTTGLEWGGDWPWKDRPHVQVRQA